MLFSFYSRHKFDCVWGKTGNSLPNVGYLAYYTGSFDLAQFINDNGRQRPVISNGITI